MARPTLDTITLIEGRLHRDLIDPAALDRIKTLARRWPALFSSYYLECRLEEGEARVDFLASIVDMARPDTAPSDLARAAAELAPLGEGDPAWARVVRFARAWAAPASPLRARIPLLWLEFDDVNGASGAALSPCLHACIDHAYMRLGGKAAGIDDGEGARGQMLDAVFEALLERSLPPAIASALGRCAERALPQGRILHASAMLSRSPAAIKLYGCLPAEGLWSYLQAIGWPGRADELRRLLDEFSSPSTSDDTIYFDLAIEERLTPYLGVVFSQPQLRAAQNRDPRREALLGLLARAGLCASHKRDALVQWPGSVRVQYPGSSEPMRMQRWLDIKLCYHPEMPARAKAYLGFMPRFSLF
jgi:hypothetical protein